jgi:cytosine/adenosine deaminase-related metal-dependent hydrolase
MNEEENPQIKIYSAQWVLPMTGDAIENGAVAIGGTRIAGVGVRQEIIERFTSAEEKRFGEAVILPGFVNAHSHLELTVMRGFLEPVEHDFFAWLRRLTKAKYEILTPDDLKISATWGAIEAARAGVTTLGDASDFGEAAFAALCDVGLRGVVYQEVFGPDPRERNQRLAELRDKVDKLRAGETRLVRVGVSPHAPYTVSAPLYEAVAGYAIEEELNLMTHASESEAETLLMQKGSGAFAENLAARGIKWRAPGVSTIKYLHDLGVLYARPMLAHCVTVDEADIEIIKATGAHIAHCPKSNAKFGHGRAPFARFIKNEVSLALGSDSVASNNTCDMLEEARFAVLLARTGKDAQGVNARTALNATTAGGAEVLNFFNSTGTLVENAEADLTVVKLDGAHQQPVYDPAVALVFASSGRDVVLTVVAGREIFSDGRVTTIDEDRIRARIAEIREKLNAA